VEVLEEFSPQWHHIFPKKYLASHDTNGLTDALANIALVSQESSYVDLGAFCFHLSKSNLGNTSAHSCLSFNDQNPTISGGETFKITIFFLTAIIEKIHRDSRFVLGLEPNAPSSFDAIGCKLGRVFWAICRKRLRFTLTSPMSGLRTW
jgi:hypothetical protein